MCVPRKPHPFGNEYHTICDRDQGRAILWRLEIVEGKDHPKKANGKWEFPCEFESSGITNNAAFMLQMTEPIHVKVKIVTMDSGFCITTGIIEMHKDGVFVQALIKKHGGYWPRFGPGNAIDNYFDGKELGETMRYEQDIDAVKFLVHCTRDEKYVSKMMSSHGILDEIQDHSTGCCVGVVWKSFK